MSGAGERTYCCFAGAAPCIQVKRGASSCQADDTRPPVERDDSRSVSHYVPRLRNCNRHCRTQHSGCGRYFDCKGSSSHRDLHGETTFRGFHEDPSLHSPICLPLLNGILLPRCTLYFSGALVSLFSVIYVGFRKYVFLI